MVNLITHAEEISHLYEGWEETMIYSALEGVMGEIYTSVGTSGEIQNAVIRLGEFLFFAGVPSHELVSFKPASYATNFAIFVSKQDENSELWNKAFEEIYKAKAKRITRYSTKKEPHVFKTELLERTFCAIPEGYSLVSMNEELFEECRGLSWGRDFVSQYESFDSFSKNAIAVLCIYNGEIVSGMSSFSNYSGGIELELATRKDHRKRGLAKCVSAKMLWECQKRGIYPSWDAANETSLKLAEYFGYTPNGSYTAYEITDY